MNTQSSQSASKDLEGTAVCCSGGGIRSASYCLGALEALTGDGNGQRPKWVTAVSGGSYIAAAGAVAAPPPQPGTAAPPPGYGAAAPRVDVGAGYEKGFKPGSRLESRLRDNTHYLAPDAAQGLRGVLSLLWGALGNMFLIGSLVYVVSALDGWLLAAIGGLSWAQGAVTLEITPAQVWIPAGLGLAAALTFFLSRLTEKPPRGDGRLWTERWAAWTAVLLALAAAAAVLLVALPALFTAVWQAGNHAQPGEGMSIPAGVAVPVIAAGAAAFAKVAAGTISAAWSRLGPGLQGNVRPWLARTGRALTPWLGSAFIVAGLLALSVFVIGISTSPEYEHWLIAAAAGVFAALHLMMDANRSSLHDFYRDRLASAYAERDRARTRMSNLTENPGLVICAAANLRTAGGRQGRRGALRGVPPGRGAVSFVFTPASTHLHLLPEPAEAEDAEPEPPKDEEKTGKGKDGEEANTSTYEDLIRPDRMTLFDLVAISGGESPR